MPSYKVIHEGEQLTLLELGDGGDVIEGGIRPKEIGDTERYPGAGDRPQNGLVLVCSWGRCVLAYRPKSGRCADCSQVNWIQRDYVTPYHRVVDGDGRGEK